jgi:hypothetical protein
MPKIRMFIIKTLSAISGEKKKRFNGKTNIFLFNPMTSFYKPKNQINLDTKDSSIFVRSLEKNYKIKINDADYKTLLSVDTTTSMIQNLISKKEALKAEKKSKPINFSYERDGVQAFYVEYDPSLSAIETMNGRILVDYTFWNKFDKWYSKNKKTLNKKPKKVPTKAKKGKNSKKTEITYHSNIPVPTTPVALPN